MMRSQRALKTRSRLAHLAPSVIAIALYAGVTVAHAQAPRPQATEAPDRRAETALRQMSLDEKLTLLRGSQPHQMNPRPDVALGAGYVPGIPRLGIPALIETDASLGISNFGGYMRKGVATAFPSASAMAATWDQDLIEQAGRAMGAETRATGFNVLLAGGVNLVREPRNGRNFEYFSEDPLLSGIMAGRAVRGIQSNRVISTVKHFALNAQETGRTGLSANLGEAALRESDLLAFQIAIEVGKPGAVMCGYNRVNSIHACESSFLLNDVLRHDWGFRGWVMSDWGAVHSIAIRQGLDQESGTGPKEEFPYFGSMLRSALEAGRVSVADVDRSARRILRTIYASGLADAPVTKGQPADFETGGVAAQQIAERGIVLLKNKGDLLPIATTAKRVLVVGGHADVGVLQGGGSSQVWPVGGAGLSLAIPGKPIFFKRVYSPSSPLKALRELLPDAEVTYDDGGDPTRAAAAAAKADIVIVFAEQFTSEGSDVPSLALEGNQDDIIAAVAATNPATVVVLETGGPVTMPWIDQVGAVMAAWYPGQRGGTAIARILTGTVNPSGRLPVTFPGSIQQSPNPLLPGSKLVKGPNGQSIYDLPKGDPQFDVAYPEGADVGYRWYERTKAVPLFAFGHGLSYTSFSYDGLSLTGGGNIAVSFRITNTGKRAGAEVAQAYAQVNGIRRLVGWQRVTLAPGESRQVTIMAEPRLLASFDVKNRNWLIAGGSYVVDVGAAVDKPLLSGKAKLNARRIKP